MIAVIGVLIGILIGTLLPFQVPADIAKYISVSFLAGLDSVIGAVRADIEEKYDFLVFASGFVMNAVIAGVLTFMGDRLGVDLYLAALVTFGVRIFENLGWIRRDLISKYRDKQALASGEMMVRS
jgi:small basic protein